MWSMSRISKSVMLPRKTILLLRKLCQLPNRHHLPQDQCMVLVYSPTLTINIKYMQVDIQYTIHDSYEFGYIWNTRLQHVSVNTSLAKQWPVWCKYARDKPIHGSGQPFTFQVVQFEFWISMQNYDYSLQLVGNRQRFESSSHSFLGSKIHTREISTR